MLRVIKKKIETIICRVSNNLNIIDYIDHHKNRTYAR